MEYKWCETNFFERVYILDIKILGRKYAGYGKCSCKKKKKKEKIFDRLRTRQNDR